jgi:hypothetical protein
MKKNDQICIRVIASVQFIRMRINKPINIYKDSMKRFYTLVATAALAVGSMVAAPQLKPAHQLGDLKAELTPKGQAILNARLANDIYMDEMGVERRGMKFTYVDANGKTWRLHLQQSGDMTSLFGSANADLNRIVMPMSVIFDSDDERLYTYGFYPTQGFFTSDEDAGAAYEDWTDTTPSSFGGTVCDLMPLEYWDTLAEYEEFDKFVMPAINEDNPNSVSIYDAANSTFCLLNMREYFKNGQTTTMGVYVTYTNGTGNPVGYPAVGTELSFRNYDDELQAIDAHLIAVVKDKSDNTIKDLDVPFSGEISTFEGFAVKDMKMTFNEVHVVNAGVQNAETNDLFDVTTWDKNLVKYYILACGEGLTYQYDWTATTMPEQPYLVEEGSSAGYRTFFAGLYSDAASTQPYGVWTVTTPEGDYNEQYDYTLWTNTPNAGDMLYGGYNGDYAPWSESDGAYIVYDGKQYIPKNGSQLLIGGKSGIQFSGLDNYKNPWTINYDGDIIYHFNPADYTEVTTISSKGNLDDLEGVDAVAADNNSAVYAANGTLTVNVEKAANVAVYTVAGALVKNVNVAAGETSFKLDGGLYIVKVGNKVAKVVL